ncbi:MAG: hypothetical protein QF475_03600, partial [Candidatus Undinarchaeales archaeon]|nr:hypothetical protein [Candidatus Undinarchaeales archaeon]
MKIRNKKGQISIGSVVKIISIVLFIVVGIQLMDMLSALGEKTAAQQCKGFLDIQLGAAELGGNAYAGIMNAIPNFAQSFGTVGPGAGSRQLTRMIVTGKGADTFSTMNEAKNEVDALNLKQELFASMPDLCGGSIKSSCTGTVREVSECLHKRIAWTYYTLGGGMTSTDYSIKKTLFKVDVEVTEPSDYVLYMSPKSCNKLAENYEGVDTESGSGVYMPGLPFGDWCKVTMNSVNYHSILLSSVVNCMEQPEGPADTRCECFYHESEGTSLSQG